jgi:hypothetical protein
MATDPSITKYLPLSNIKLGMYMSNALLHLISDLDLNK